LVLMLLICISQRIEKPRWRDARLRLHWRREALWCPTCLGPKL